MEPPPDAIPVANFPAYRITPNGEVWSCGIGHGHTGEWYQLKAGRKNGYPMVWLYKGGKRYARLVHRLVLETFVGDCPSGMECLHTDNTKANIALGNLRWGTRKENEADKLHHGTHNRGERCGAAKLTDAQATEIRRRNRSGEKQRDLAKAFGVSPTTVSNICRRQCRKHHE